MKDQLEDQTITGEMTLCGNREQHGHRQQRAEKAEGVWQRATSLQWNDTVYNSTGQNRIKVLAMQNRSLDSQTNMTDYTDQYLSHREQQGHNLNDIGKESLQGW